LLLENINYGAFANDHKLKKNDIDANSHRLNKKQW